MWAGDGYSWDMTWIEGETLSTAGVLSLLEVGEPVREIDVRTGYVKSG